jgi:RNA polymerase sigma factor (sigma-70 family)
MAMATTRLSNAIEGLRRSMLAREGAAWTDGRLLSAFISHRDEAAFEAIVRRHGPMVMGVCQRVLRDRHDAEDAFQTTFLVLVRKAGSIAGRELLANWLYGTAYNTALKAKAGRTKQHTREKPMPEVPEAAAPPEALWSDLQALLDRELSLLAEKYRLPVVLCDLEGRTRKEAAKQLGWSEGTLSGRLARARATLARRLARHGLDLSGALLASVLSHHAVSACVPVALVRSTAKAASLIAAGQALGTGIVSLEVAALTEGVLKMMLLSNLKMVGAFILTMVLVAGGAGGLLYRTQAGEDRIAAGQNGKATTPRGQARNGQEQRAPDGFEGLAAPEGRNADVEQLQKIENEADRLLAKLEAVNTALREIDKAMKKLRARAGKQTEIEALEEIKNVVDELRKKAKAGEIKSSTFKKTITLAEKSFTFEMRNKPWSAVFEWLTEKTGREFISSATPAGTMNFIAPKGKKFTIPEIIDIINDSLRPKWLLINRGASFTTVPADERIDPALVPRIPISELGQHGKTEIVSTVYQCKAFVAEDSGPDVKKQMGPFGEVQVLHRANQLLLQDTVANLMRIKRELDAQEEKEAGGGQAETLAYKCIYIRARDAEATLRNFLGEQKIEGGGSQGGGSQGGGSQGGGKGGGQATTARVRSYTVTSDERTNTVLVNGPPDKISQARQALRQLDVGTVPFRAGAPFLQTYPVKEGKAADFAKTLSEIYQGSANIKIAPIGSTQLMVLASPEDQMMIAEQINAMKTAATKTQEAKQAGGAQAESYSHKCQLIRARDAETALRTFLGVQKQTRDSQRPAANGPGAPEAPATRYTITSDDATNTVFVTGPPDKITQAKMVMKLLDVANGH